MKRVHRQGAGIMALFLAFLLAFTGVFPVIANAAENYDIDAPVIGEFTLSNNQGNVTSADKLDVTLQAEDHGVGIGEIDIYFSFENTGNSYQSLNYYSNSTNNSLTYDETNKVYKGSISLRDIPKAGKVYVQTVTVKDKNGNKASLEGLNTQDPSSGRMTPNYFVNVTPTEGVADFQLQSFKVGKTTYDWDPASSKNTITFTENAERKIKSSENNEAQLIFTKEVTGVDHFVAIYEMDANGAHYSWSGDFRVDDSTVDTVYGYIDGYLLSGKGKMTSLRAVYTDGSSKTVELGDTNTEFEKVVDTDSSDDANQNHEISEIHLKKGDTELTDTNALQNILTDKDVLTVTVKPDVKLDKESVASAGLRIKTTNDVDVEKYIELTYNAEDNTYVGTLTIDKDMYPTIWKANYMDVYSSNNGMHYGFSGGNTSNSTFIVQHGTTVVLPKVNTSVNVQGYYEDSDSTGKTSWRTGTLPGGYRWLKDLDSYSSLPVDELKLPTASELKAPEEFGTFEGWYAAAFSYGSFQQGVPIDQYVVTPNSGSIMVYPKYSNAKTMASGSYYDKDGFSQTLSADLPAEVNSRSSAESYFKNLLKDKINENASGIRISGNPFALSISSVINGGMKSVNVTYNFYGKETQGYIYKQRLIFYKDSFTKDDYDSIFSVSLDDVYDSENATGWKVSNRSSIQTYDELKKQIDSNKGYFALSVTPKYNGTSKYVGIYFTDKKNNSTVVKADPNWTIAELEKNIQSLRKAEMPEGLTFVKWSLSDNDTNAKTVGELDDVYTLDAEALAKESYATILVSDKDGIQGFKEYTVVADANGKITLPSSNGDYKYLSYDDVSSDLAYGGTVTAKPENGIGQHLEYEANGSNKAVPGRWVDGKYTEPTNTKDQPKNDPTPSTPTVPAVNPAAPAVSPAAPAVNPATPIVDDASTPDINESTNPTQAEEALVAANQGKLERVLAAPGKDGGIKATKDVVDQQVNKVAAAIAKIAETPKKKGQKAPEVKIEMNGANIVPARVLQEAKGHDINVKFDMGGYSWTVNGKDIGDINLQDINLAVDINTDAVPSNAVKALAGGKETQQISLRHDGAFGFKATLTLQAPKDTTGKYGNLYWYDSNHKLVFQDSGLVKADGSLELDFSHASDYVIVYGDNMGTKAAKAPKTNDTNEWRNMIILLTLAIGAGVVGTSLLRKKEED
ncbi:MAG: hypothetical protein SPK77_01100 [Lachnospiraceae bacterium]|nr:hypothetical protein [Lachnospiraceae bacterium]